MAGRVSGPEAYLRRVLRRSDAIPTAATPQKLVGTTAEPTTPVTVRIPPAVRWAARSPSDSADRVRAPPRSRPVTPEGSPVAVGLGGGAPGEAVEPVAYGIEHLIG